MTTNQNTNEDDVLDENLNGLLKQVDKINNDIDQMSKETSDELKNIEENIDQNIKEIDKGLSELDVAEQETEKEMEKLMMEEAEGMAKDDEDEENEDKEE